jgi:DNA-binding GntR family transcriptional regulator
VSRATIDFVTPDDHAPLAKSSPGALSAPLSPTLTKAEYAAQILRTRIRSGELAPGERLAVDRLKHEFAMSPTPIREALRVLQTDGLVEYRPHHGIFVATLSAEDVEEIFRLRVTLETMAIERAVELLDADGLARLDAIHAELIEASDRHAEEEVAELNSRWHWALYHEARSPRLADYVERLWEAFPWRVFSAIPGSTEHTVAEHSAIQAAVHAGKAKEASKLLGAHILRGKQTLLQRVRAFDEEREA